MTHFDERDNRPPGTEWITAKHDWNSGESLNVAIVRAVSSATGIPAADLPPLHDSIDSDALDMLFKPASSSNQRNEGGVSFPLGSAQVRVHASGEIVVFTATDKFEE